MNVAVQDILPEIASIRLRMEEAEVVDKTEVKYDGKAIIGVAEDSLRVNREDRQ